jgi:hypothetical protein
MVIPPQLSGFSALERTVLQHARALTDVMLEHGLETLDTSLLIADPPGGGQLMRCEISLGHSDQAGRVCTVRVLHTRITLAMDDLRRPDLLDGAGDGAFLPRRDEPPASTATGAPLSGDARSHTHAAPTSGGEGRAT